MNIMKATGIVRRIDDLGRVVLPKEIRRTMRISQGDPLEIYTSNEGEIILKKYSPLEDFTGTASQLAEAVYKAWGVAVAVMNKEIVVANAGAQKKDILQHKVSQEAINLINGSQLYIWNSGTEKIPVVDITAKYFAKSIMPIFSYGDPIGAVALTGLSDSSDEAEESEIKIIKALSFFLGRQVDN